MEVYYADETELPSADGLHGPETNDRVVNNDDGVSVDHISTSRPSVQKVQQANSEAVDFTTSLNKTDNFYETKPLSRKKSHHRTEKVESSRKHSKGKATTLLTPDAKPQNSRTSVEHQGEKNALGHEKTTSEPSTSAPSATLSSSAIPLPSKAKVSQASSTSSGLKTSMQRVVQHFRPPKSSKLTQPSSSINEVTTRVYIYNCKVQLFNVISVILSPILMLMLFVCADELFL